MKTNHSSIDWKAIEDFVGFGNPDAHVLFLGMEEGLSADVSLEDDLAARSGYRKYEDLFKAQTSAGRLMGYFGTDPKSQRTWRPMCHLMLRRSHVADIDNEKRCRYQADHLGREDGDTLLAELLPYPNPNTDVWPYGERYPNRESMVDERVKLLENAFEKSHFELVVAYGKGNWEHYRRIFEAPQWNANGAFEVGYCRKIKIVLSPHFATPAFNSEAQLDAFADVALGS
jgi:hypothetical protein